MASEFDLDVTFDEGEPDLSAVPRAELERAVAELPDALRVVAQGLLIEKRTMSDVSQDLGLRQGELVTRLHRATLALAATLAPNGTPARN